MNLFNKSLLLYSSFISKYNYGSWKKVSNCQLINNRSYSIKHSEPHEHCRRNGYNNNRNYSNNHRQLPKWHIGTFLLGSAAVLTQVAVDQSGKTNPRITQITD